MTDTKFTPGPWVASDEVHGKCGGIIHIKDGKYSEICTMWSSGLENEDEFLVNANLIAAAPDLYEALERMKIWCEDEVGAELPCDSINAALAKARGE